MATGFPDGLLKWNLDENLIIDVSETHSFHQLLHICQKIIHLTSEADANRKKCRICVACRSIAASTALSNFLKSTSNLDVFLDTDPELGTLSCKQSSVIVFTNCNFIPSLQNLDQFNEAETRKFLVIFRCHPGDLENSKFDLQITKKVFDSILWLCVNTLQSVNDSKELLASIRLYETSIDGKFSILNFTRYCNLDDILRRPELCQLLLYMGSEKESLDQGLQLYFTRAKRIDDYISKTLFYTGSLQKSEDSVIISNCNFNCKPSWILDTTEQCLKAIGPFGCLVAAKKVLFDLEQVINSILSKMSADNRGQSLNFGATMARTFQLLNHVELLSLDSVEVANDCVVNAEKCFWQPAILKVFERICSFDPPDSQSLIVCRSGLTCVAVACSLRLLFRNVNTGDEEDKKKVVSIGHLTECYSQDKVVQLVHTRKQSDFWFEILQQKKFSVAVTTYEMLKAIPRRQTYAFTTYCFDLPESVQELTLLYRVSSYLHLLSEEQETTSIAKQKIDDLICSVQVIKPHLFSKYFVLCSENSSKHVFTDMQSSWPEVVLKLEESLLECPAFETLKRHRDKYPRDSYHKASILFFIDTKARQMTMVYFAWRLHHKQVIGRVLDNFATNILATKLMELSEEALNTLKSVAEVSESNSVVKRRTLIRHIAKDLNEQEDEELLLSIEQDTVSETITKGLLGSKKRKRVYPKLFPTYFHNSIPIETRHCCFYSINMSMYKANQSRDNYDDLNFSTDQCYGVITCTAFPAHTLPKFTVHTREGEELVEITFCQRIILSEDEIDSVAIFHQYLFNDVLRIEKDTLVFDPNESPVQYYVVLATRDEDGVFIDFQVMSDVINESQILFKQEHPFKFREDNFANAVVSPMYRKTERPHRMYVVKIRHDLNPLSEFPQSNLYETYSDYYRIKYGADISNLKQPLLEVEYTNLRLNLLTSRVHKSKQEKSMSSRVKEVVENDADKQFFVPELCYIWPIAAPLWKKTVCLPSILYRMEQLLMSDCIVSQIHTEALDSSSTATVSRRHEGIALNSNWDKNNFELQYSRKDLCEKLSGSEVTNVNILQCFTTSMCTDIFHLERIETIGDSFLKYVVSVSLALSSQQASSGELSINRCRYISNENLFKIGVQKNLPGSIYNQIFDPSSNWLPPCYVYQPYEQVESTSEANYVKFSEEWKSVETGVWNNQATQGASMGGIPDWNPRRTNEETYRLWSQNVATRDTGVDWGALPNAVPVNGGTNGSSFSSRGFGVFSLSDDLLSSIDDAAFNDELQDYLFEAPADEANAISQSSNPNKAAFGNSKMNGSTGLDRSSLPSPYIENCLSDKTIADVVEAMIGCYFVQSGSEAASKIMNWFGLPTIQENPIFHCYKRVATLDANERRLYNSRSFAQLEDKVSYRFNNKRILLEAFIHPSTVDINLPFYDYQRLEFVGDAVLDFLITREIYFHPQYFNSGALTDLRAALVNNIIFASIAVSNNLHHYLIHNSPSLSNHIHEFICFRQTLLQSRDEDSSEKPTVRQSQLGLSDDLRWEEHSCDDVEVPKPLGDIFESFAAAVYIDCGFDLETVWKVFEPLMKSTIDSYSKDIPLSPMRELMELEPGRVIFERIEDTIDHKVQVRVTVTALSSYIGTGITVRGAKAAAAQQALKDIKSRREKNSSTDVNDS